MVDPLGYLSFQPVLHDWCNNSHGMCYPVYGMLHIKEPLLLIGKMIIIFMIFFMTVAAAGFLSPYLSGSLPHVRWHITVNKMC